MPVQLSPTQQQEVDRLLHATSIGSVFVMHSRTGMGKTTILHEVHRQLGGGFLTMNEFVHALRDKEPLSLEETFERMVMSALTAHDNVFVDDLHLISNVICSCGFSSYPRANFLLAPLTTLCSFALDTRKRLCFGCDGTVLEPLKQRASFARIDNFKPEDYAFFGKLWLQPEQHALLDYEKIYRFSPKLNAHQLRGAFAWLKQTKDLDTTRFIEYLRSQRMASNVALDEVQEVQLHDLKGIEDVITSLETNLILPLENDTLAQELDIRPKRGVLLAGPPGTGKTSIGKALAHRLKSKFFLIDGTYISGTRNFYDRVRQVFEAAQQNAPSIIFIDDSDVIFESGQEMGLYRYLLTMLDGLESNSTGRVCVMMTAMNVGNLPPALIRSGRIELWLETRLPDSQARTAILNERVLQLPPSMGNVDVERLVELTEGLTGADIKRVMEDGKLLYAYDRSLNLPMRETTDYIAEAVETVRNNKAKYAEAEETARQRHPSRPPWFDMFGAMAMAGMEEE